MIKCMIFNQILPTSNIRNLKRIVRRMWMLILGLKGLIMYFHTKTNHVHGTASGLQLYCRLKDSNHLIVRPGEVALAPIGFRNFALIGCKIVQFAVLIS